MNTARAKLEAYRESKKEQQNDPILKEEPVEVRILYVVSIFKIFFPGSESYSKKRGPP